MASTQTPIGLFVYNRPDHTQRALTALTRCDRFEECRLVIYCDGPKTPAQKSSVLDTRRVVKDWASRVHAEVIEHSENLGLAHSIVAGVTEQCQKHGRVIVIEDDLVVSPDFLDYMLQATERYQDFANLYQVSAFMFPVEHPASPDAFFLPFTTTWGWATWERAWKIFDWDARGANHIETDNETLKRFNLNNSYPYYEMLKNRLAGRNDSWGILWWYAVFNAGGMVLHPRRSLVWNGGFDATGVHAGSSKNTMQSDRQLFDSPRLSHPIIFPSEIAVDNQAYARISHYLLSVRGVGMKSKIFRIIRKVQKNLRF